GSISRSSKGRSDLEFVPFCLSRASEQRACVGRFQGMSAANIPPSEEGRPAPIYALRHDRRPGDLSRVLDLHERVYLQEQDFGWRFAGYVAEGLGQFAQRY